jgi:23S rRNA (guanosine2251-2'-O)-methyltransferase
MQESFVVIVHNVRSAHNVGSIFRTADGAGVEKIYLTGYTPCPHLLRESVAGEPAPYDYLTKAEKTLAKTALGAENNIAWERCARLGPLLKRLHQDGFEIVALEQDESSVDYRDYQPKTRTALLVGNEVLGVDPKILRQCDAVIEIPMRGKKDSLNVSVAFGIASFEIKSKIERGVRTLRES